MVTKSGLETLRPGGHPCFNARSICLQPCPMRLLASAHAIEVGRLGIGTSECVLHAGKSRIERVSFIRSGNETNLGDETIDVTGGQRRDRGRAVLGGIGDAMHPFESAIVVRGVQTGGHDRRDQPSPCLCFHIFISLYPIDEPATIQLATEDTNWRTREFPQIKKPQVL